MRLLGVLRLGGVAPRLVGQVGISELGLDETARLRDRLLCNLYAVGPHIGDQADGLAAEIGALVKLLRQAHGARGAETQFARGFLLQGRCGERRLRVAPGLLRFDAHGLKVPRLAQAPAGCLGALAVGQVVALELTAFELGQARLERFARVLGQDGLDAPVLAGPEGLDFRFPVTDQAQRNRLHPSGRPAARQLAPEDRRERESHEIIQGASGQVGVDQFLVERARLRKRLLDRTFGDLVEHDAVNFDTFQRPAPFQFLGDVPGNGLAFAVRVGCQVEPIGPLERIGDIRDALVGPSVHLPDHGKALFGLHRSILGRQIPHMAVARQDLVVLAEVLVDGLGLGRRFDDDDVHLVQSESHISLADITASDSETQARRL